MAKSTWKLLRDTVVRGLETLGYWACHYVEMRRTRELGRCLEHEDSGYMNSRKEFPPRRTPVKSLAHVRLRE